MLEKEVAELDGDLRRVMRKIVAEAEGQQMAGNVHLSKDRYADATDAFQKAAELYRKVIDGRELLEKLAETYKKTLRARMLAQSADKKKLDEVRRFEINAEGFLEAGDIERAIAELQKACTAYEALVPKREPATLEDAVAARTAMIAARAALPEKPRGLDWPFAVSRSRAVTTGPAKPRTLSNVLEQATAAESAASKALKNREYAPARDLFVQAEKSIVRRLRFRRSATASWPAGTPHGRR